MSAEINRWILHVFAVRIRILDQIWCNGQPRRKTYEKSI